MKNHYKLWIILSFLAVFIAGIFGGFILERNILSKKSHRSSRPPRDDSRHIRTIDDMAQELGLSDQQKEQIQAVFKNNEARLKEMRHTVGQQYRELRGQFLEEIKNVLDQDQIKKFEAMIEKFHEQRKKQLEPRRKRPPSAEDKGASK